MTPLAFPSRRFQKLSSRVSFIVADALSLPIQAWLPSLCLRAKPADVIIEYGKPIEPAKMPKAEQKFIGKKCRKRPGNAEKESGNAG